MKTIRSYMACVVLALALGGCATTGETPVNQQYQEAILQAQQLIATTCRWSEPLVNLAKIWANGKYQSAFDMASAVCATVGRVTVTARRGGGTVRVTVSGVRLRGHRI